MSQFILWTCNTGGVKFPTCTWTLWKTDGSGRRRSKNRDLFRWLTQQFSTDLAIEITLPDAECKRGLIELYTQGLNLKIGD